MEKQVSLKQYNTFGIDVKANLFDIFSTEEELKSQLNNASEPVLILGGGSNILFTKDFEGTILKNNIQGINAVEETDDYIILKVGAGVTWHTFVLDCVDKGYYGVENLSLIPGTVGASPIQNIGAYGVEVKDVITQVEFLDKETKSIKSLLNHECNFGYRDSVFKKELKGTFVTTYVYFKLTKSANLNTSYGAIENVLNSKNILSPTLKDVSDAVIEIRSSKLPDPNEIGNAGSFFKNPVIDKTLFDSIHQKHPNIPSYPVSDTLVKVPAGWLIEQAGWKGKTLGNIGVHKNQALVLVNYGDGKGSELMDLAYKIQSSVKQMFNIDIVPEVNLI